VHENWLVWQLADSAFPTGGFAHSWGLEAAYQCGEVVDPSDLGRFLRDAVWQAGRGALPLLTEAHRAPSRLAELDALADAFLTNPVVNRASRVQGRAFLGTCARVWPCPELDAVHDGVPDLCGHVAPLMGAALRRIGVPLGIGQRLYLFNTARGVVAAAVRLGIVGSYAAQRLQWDCGGLLEQVAVACSDLGEREVVQTAPIADLLQASHDRLYSRLFQS
jgi:urease accessory protein